MVVPAGSRPEGSGPCTVNVARQERFTAEPNAGTQFPGAINAGILLGADAAVTTQWRFADGRARRRGPRAAKAYNFACAW